MVSTEVINQGLINETAPIWFTLNSTFELTQKE